MINSFVLMLTGLFMVIKSGFTEPGAHSNALLIIASVYLSGGFICSTIWEQRSKKD